IRGTLVPGTFVFPLSRSLHPLGLCTILVLWDNAYQVFVCFARSDSKSCQGEPDGSEDLARPAHCRQVSGRGSLRTQEHAMSSISNQLDVAVSSYDGRMDGAAGLAGGRGWLRPRF